MWCGQGGTITSHKIGHCQHKHQCPTQHITIQHIQHHHPTHSITIQHTASPSNTQHHYPIHRFVGISFSLGITQVSLLTAILLSIHLWITTIQSVPNILPLAGKGVECKPWLCMSYIWGWERVIMVLCPPPTNALYPYCHAAPKKSHHGSHTISQYIASCLSVLNYPSRFGGQHR